MSLVFNGQVCLVRKRRKKRNLLHRKEIEGSSAASPSLWVFWLSSHTLKFFVILVLTPLHIIDLMGERVFRVVLFKSMLRGPKNSTADTQSLSKLQVDGTPVSHIGFYWFEFS